MAYNKNDKADGAKFRRGGMRRRKKVCVFCGEKNGTIDYKDVNKLKRYVSERGKILPRRKKLWGLIFLQKSRKFPSVFPVFFHLRLSRISL